MISEFDPQPSSIRKLENREYLLFLFGKGSLGILGLYEPK